MSIDKNVFQTIILRKSRIEEVRRKLQKRTRAPLVKIVDLAIYNLLTDPDAEKKLMDWLEREEAV